MLSVAGERGEEVPPGVAAHVTGQVATDLATNAAATGVAGEVAADIDADIDADIAANIAADIAAHVAGCAGCRRTVEQLRVLDGALRALPAWRVPSPPPFERIARRARAAARRRRQVRVVRRLLPLTLAVASAVAVTVGITRLVHQREPRLSGAGHVLDAARGVVEAVLADGARLTVTAGKAVVEVSERGRAIVRLESGAAFLSVPHLDGSATFRLTTEEAEVRVRGTRFEVARGVQGTRVTVSEGTVEVRPRAATAQSFLLGQGESRLVEGLAARRQEARAAALASFEQRDDSTTGEKIEAWLATGPPAQEEAEAHALRAWKLSRDGDRDGALRAYRRALALLPAGVAPLWADNASAQLALLIEREDPKQGASAWRSYLARFPGGVHAVMAQERLARRRPGGAR
jgi:hypothetical protein